MGTYSKGILGAFSGKVGPVVGSTWRGKDIMRSLPRKGNRIATAAQMLQRSKFIMATEFLTPLNPIITKYFGSNNGITTRRNKAMSYTLREAITYSDPILQWDFSKVLISRGVLLGLNAATAVAGATSSITLNWADNSGSGEAEESDKLIVVVYEETTKTSVSFLNAGARDQETASLIVPEFLSGLRVQIWATFASIDDSRYATSLYLGQIMVA